MKQDDPKKVQMIKTPIQQPDMTQFMKKEAPQKVPHPVKNTDKSKPA